MGLSGMSFSLSGARRTRLAWGTMRAEPKEWLCRPVPLEKKLFHDAYNDSTSSLMPVFLVRAFPLLLICVGMEFDVIRSNNIALGP